MDEIKTILETQGLKKTPSRKDILSLFIENDFAISQSFLEDHLEGLDRVTIYRTLNTFEDKGLIHKIKGADNEVKYAYCSDHCHDGKHDHDHLHFTCNNCEKTYCLDQTKPSLILPEGYFMKQVSILVEGICKSCNSTK
ncbi:MAG: Fur family ferric uptake transcriptional regulator [Patiriisocius sp.]|jgi:Fur family ferric uptake transcriptional regulator